MSFTRCWLKLERGTARGWRLNATVARLSRFSPLTETRNAPGSAILEAPAATLDIMQEGRFA